MMVPLGRRPVVFFIWLLILISTGLQGGWEDWVFPRHNSQEFPGQTPPYGAQQQQVQAPLPPSWVDHLAFPLQGPGQMVAAYEFSGQRQDRPLFLSSARIMPPLHYTEVWEPQVLHRVIEVLAARNYQLILEVHERDRLMIQLIQSYLSLLQGDEEDDDEAYLKSESSEASA